jgi:hypothetical protein
MEETVKHQFEALFVKHYERLTNTRQSIGGLPFTIENIVCFILFGGRELDIEDIYGDVSERYSMETFKADARDAGIDTDDHVQKAIDDLVVKKFLHLQPDGKFYSYQATRETARMLNRVYPKMQGLSLLAYIGQTMQEVESGRIDLESALSRFDQTLQNHGVPLPKPKIPVIAPTPKPVTQAKKTEETKPSSSRIIRDYVVATPAKAKPEKPSTPQAAAPTAAIPHQAPAPAPHSATLPDAGADAVLPPVAPEPAIDNIPPAPPIGNRETPTVPPPPQEEKEQVVVDDEAIAAKIAAFEKELALVCPICKTHILKEEKTAAGKLFYSCTSDQCNFISWGKPHHTACVRCKNPFMVEVADSEGNVFLKCPRATCQYRMPLSAAGSQTGGVKKVVRKRLVRRKV